MTLWRYRAVPLNSTSGRASVAGGAGSVQSGELSAETAADVRAALRRVGLQAVDLRPQSNWHGIAGWRAWLGFPSRGHDLGVPPQAAAPSDSSLVRAWRTAHALVLGRWLQHLRQRRAQQRAELYDSLATMLEAGLPLLDAIDTLISSSEAKGSALRTLLTAMREQLRDGAAPGQTMESPRTGGPSWFSPVEVAMVHAAHASGNLPGVLRRLAVRSERAGELTRRLVGALTYPAIVAIVGLGVVIFLSLKTLPGLVKVLEQSKLSVPPLTEAVMGFGRFVASQWLVVALAAAVVLLAASMAPVLIIRIERARHAAGSSLRLGRLLPRVAREMAVARFARQLAEMLGAGVPIVESIHVIAPALGAPEATRSIAASSIGGGLSGALLHHSLRQAAMRMQRGEELTASLDDPLFFSAEFRRLVDVGQASGELPAILERLAERSERRVARLIDRLAALLEPAVILTLATLIGIVVMAALLPLLRLQQMFG